MKSRFLYRFLKTNNTPNRTVVVQIWGVIHLEAPPGIGPGIEVLQTFALPLGYGAVFSSERGSPHSVSYSKAAPYVTAFERKRARILVPEAQSDHR